MQFLAPNVGAQAYLVDVTASQPLAGMTTEKSEKFIEHNIDSTQIFKIFSVPKNKRTPSVSCKTNFLYQVSLLKKQTKTKIKLLYP